MNSVGPTDMNVDLALEFTVTGEHERNHFFKLTSVKCVRQTRKDLILCIISHQESTFLRSATTPV